MSKTLAMLVNTTSQRAIGRADRVEAELNEAGWVTIRASRSPGQSVEQIAEKVSGSQALVVVGGDGTVRLMADVAGYLDIPIWQIGAGNENLFARSLGMKSDSASLIAAAGTRERPSCRQARHQWRARPADGLRGIRCPDRPRDRHKEIRFRQQRELHPAYTSCGSQVGSHPGSPSVLMVSRRSSLEELDRDRQQSRLRREIRSGARCG